jgi:hypothetical protein
MCRKIRVTEQTRKGPQLVTEYPELTVARQAVAAQLEQGVAVGACPAQ